MERTSSRHGFIKRICRIERLWTKDPLIEYKNEGYDMFLEMMTNMRRNVIYSMFMFQPKIENDSKIRVNLISPRNSKISLSLRF